MTPEFIAIIAVGITLAGLIFTMNARLERRVDRVELRIDRLEDDMKQRFDSMDVRLRAMEQSQSHLAGEMATLREAILLQPAVRE